MSDSAFHFGRLLVLYSRITDSLIQPLLVDHIFGVEFPTWQWQHSSQSKALNASNRVGLFR